MSYLCPLHPNCFQRKEEEKNGTFVKWLVLAFKANGTHHNNRRFVQKMNVKFIKIGHCRASDYNRKEDRAFE